MDRKRRLELTGSGHRWVSMNWMTRKSRTLKMQKHWSQKQTMPSGHLDKIYILEAEVVASTIEEAGVQAEEISEAVVGAKVVKEDEVAAVDLVEVIHATHVEKQAITVDIARRKMLSASTVERSVMLSLRASTRRMKLHACRERECVKRFVT